MREGKKFGKAGMRRCVEAWCHCYQHFLQTSLINKRNDVLEQKTLRRERDKNKESFNILRTETFFLIESKDN